MALTYKDVVELYVAMFQRAPEKDGVVYWLNVASINNLSRAQLAFEMAKAAVNLVSSKDDYKLAYPHYVGVNLDNLTESQARMIITKMYEILFNKSYKDDPDGINYWVNLIVNKKMNFGVVVDGMLQAAKTYLNSTDTAAKNAAQAFVNRVDAAEKISNIIKSFDGNFSKFQDYISSVNHDKSTVDAVVNVAMKSNTRFTDKVDNVVGTTHDDVFYASAGTLNNNDILAGGAGVDTLIVELNNSATPILTGVENLKVEFSGTTPSLNLSKSIGVQNVDIKTSDAKGTIEGISSPAIKFAIDGSNDVELKYASGALAGSSDKVDIELKGYGSGKKLTITPNNGEKLETLSLKSSVSDNKLKISAALKSLLISGDKKIEITSSSSSIAQSGQDLTIDASGLSADLTLSSLNVNGAKNLIITGTNSGKNNISFSSSSSVSGDATIKTGDKNDTINLSNLTVSTGKKVTIDSGNGSDKITLSNSKDIIVLNKNYSGFDTISGFNTSNDQFKVTGFTDFKKDVNDTDVKSENLTLTNEESYEDASIVLLKLFMEEKTNTLGNDDNILVLKKGSGNLQDPYISYIYYYSDTNSNKKYDTGDTLKLLAIVDKEDLTNNPENYFTT